MTTADATADLSGWTKGSFTAAGITHDTYRRGSGPGIIVVHEIPGITPAVLRFADEVVDAGFTVVMPDVVGTPGRAPSGAYLASSMAGRSRVLEFSHWVLHRLSCLSM